MNGLAMLGGLNGFREGFRFGRELVEGTEDERKSRLAAEQAQNEMAGKAMADRRKTAFEAAKFDELQKYHAGLQDNANRGLNVQEANLGLNQRRYDEGAPQREATLTNTGLQTDRLERERAEQLQHQAWREGAAKKQQELDEVLNGRGTPEAVARWAPTLGLVAQDAPAARDKLNNLVAQSQQLAQQGKVPEADALWSTPEGRDALNAAWGPLIKRPVGQITEGGKYVIKDVSPTGLIRDPNGNRLGVNLEVTRGPTPEYKRQLEGVLASNASPEQKAEAQRELQDSKYTAPLTNERTPVAQGGTIRYFTPQDFAQGVSMIDRLATEQERDPEKFNRIRGRVAAIASGKTREESNAKLLQYDEAARDDDAKAADLKLREERLALDKEKNANGAVGKDQTLTRQRMTMGAWEKLTKVPFTKNAEDEYKQDPVELERMNKIRMKGYDLIRNSDGNISLEEVMKKAKEGLPSSASEVRAPVDDIAGFGNTTPSQRRTPEHTATDANGQKMGWFGDHWEPM